MFWWFGRARPLPFLTYRGPVRVPPAANGSWRTTTRTGRGETPGTACDAGPANAARPGASPKAASAGAVTTGATCGTVVVKRQPGVETGRQVGACCRNPL